MRERLEKFMKTEGLAPSRFAEIMGVQPSSISHILGGRNKPSFDFIEKILLRFPKVNPDWLLLGKGTMYRTVSDPTLPVQAESVAAPALSPSASHQATIPSPVPDTHVSHIPVDTGSLFDYAESQTAGETVKTIQPEPFPGKTDSGDAPQTRQMASVTTEQPRNSMPSKTDGPKKRSSEQLAGITQAMANAGNPSSIERIVIFLKDKTFISYTPEE